MSRIHKTLVVLNEGADHPAAQALAEARCPDRHDLEQLITVQGDPIWAGLVAAYANALRSRCHGHLLRRVGEAVQTTDQLPDSTPSGQALFWSDSTICLRDVDARQLGGEVR